MRQANRAAPALCSLIEGIRSDCEYKGPGGNVQAHPERLAPLISRHAPLSDDADPYNPPPQRYCQASPTASKSPPVRATTPELA